MVESGRLALDEDVNRRLTSWKVPDSPFTRDQKSRCAASCPTRPALLSTISQATPWGRRARPWFKC